MTPLQLELIQLIGRKELSFGCKVKVCIRDYDREGTVIEEINEKFRVKPDDSHYQTSDFESYDCEIIGHPATISDFHRYVNDKYFQWKQLDDVMYIVPDEGDTIMIMYNSGKELLDQDEETLKQIVELVKSNKY